MYVLKEKECEEAGKRRKGEMERRELMQGCSCFLEERMRESGHKRN